MPRYINEKDVYAIFEGGNGIQRIHVSEIDVLPRTDIVLCKDCANYYPVCPTCGNCYRTTYIMKPTDFCSRGRRKDQTCKQ